MHYQLKISNIKLLAIKSVLLCSILLAAVGCSAPIHVDLIVHNGVIYTLDENFAVAEAMAIKDGKIVEVGPENQILNKYTSDTKVDAEKSAIYPGFIDAHCHFLGFGLGQKYVDLKGTVSFEDVLNRIQGKTNLLSEEWIIGRGWDQNDWTDSDFPNNELLDQAFPDKYVALTRIDGHAMLVSANVLDLAGIDKNTVIAGGEILYEQGILIDAAMELVEKVLPKPNKNTKIEALLYAQNSCLGLGLTTVDDAGLSIEDINLINESHVNSILKMRIYAMYSASNEVLRNMSKLSIETDRLTAKSVKLYADGALGSRGASLKDPYSDDTATLGLLFNTSDSVERWAKACFDNGFQLNVHCIGDQSNHQVLTSMGKVLGGSNDRRWRIEHAQVIDSKDLQLFNAFNIIPSVQPTHATSDMLWAEDRLGKDRIKTAYAYKTLLNQNGLIALGTDFPVESNNPFETFYSAVYRKNAEQLPADGFLVDQALTREEAIKGMTIWAAISNFEEAKKGSLSAEKFADFVVLKYDLMKCTESEILNNYVIQTWINGELVFKR